MPARLTPDEVQQLPEVREAVARGFILIDGGRVYYRLKREQSQAWADPEEWVRCACIAHLIVSKGYPPARMAIEVQVPRRTPSDLADIVVYRDDRCRVPFIVVENKPDGQTAAARRQAIEQGFGNANSLRADFALYDEWSTSVLFDTSGTYGSMEREENQRGDRTRVPTGYSTEETVYRFVAGQGADDVQATTPARLEAKVRRTHSIIWSGGKRDPLTSFDEWSKLLFAKVHDERSTPNGEPRRFQIGSGETATTVANRVHQLFAQAATRDTSIFPEGIRINLADAKIAEVVSVLQDISIVNTEVDAVGMAFERFFGSVFRGELGQYFTMRPVARFTVAAMDIGEHDYVVDPSAGSGGFLLETLLQVWKSIERRYGGQAEEARIKNDFALQGVYGIEIHEILARILKINLLLHHDGHTNVEGDRSCLDTEFQLPRLRRFRGQFTRIVGNPPFGDTVRAGDEDLLGANTLDAFEVARGRVQVASEHVIVERCVDMLADGGRFGLVIPDGMLNNQGELSNCPQVRRYLASRGVIEAIVSLPDYAFRKSGAQNKTSILIFRKFRAEERARFDRAMRDSAAAGGDDDAQLVAGLAALDYHVFMAEAHHIGYTSTGQSSDRNELYTADADGFVAEDQAGSILGELARFRSDPASYDGSWQPDCMAINVVEMWNAHPSHRFDPKYFLFKLEEETVIPEGWVRRPILEVMERREELVRPEQDPDADVTVMTLSQTGDIRAREAGKGKNPPEWKGMYFSDMPTKWYRSHAGDVVFSGIDLWKGCIAVVPDEFDGALVSKEFPIYRVTDERIEASFLSTLLRSRYYQRAFRAITTGHSNRRRTQSEDFEALEICFPADREVQRSLVGDVLTARATLRESDAALKDAMLRFSDVIDNRGDEEYELDADEAEGGEAEGGEAET